MNSNPVVWFEIYVQDMERAAEFYETVLDTKLTDMSEMSAEMQMRTFPMEDHGDGAAGALTMMPGVPSGPGGTMVYFKSEDCAVEAARVEAAGGRLERAKESIGEYGYMAIAWDTEGNMFGLHSMK